MRAWGLVWVVGLVGCPAAETGSDGPGTGSDAGSESTSESTSGTGTDADADTDGGSSTETGVDGTTESGPPQTGELTILTYNVAGLPQGISGSNPEQNIPQISPLLNAFPIALVQEDFWYHAELIADVEHAHQSDPFPEDPARMGIGDGLNRFSDTPFELHERQQWFDCHGQLDCSSDCLARKGWSFARHTLADGVEVDVYNLHMEAGGCPEDIEIRLQATLDLAEAIAERSDGRAVIVAGDFNLRATDPEDVMPLANIIEGAGLTDVCGALDCGDERIDKVLIRDGESVTLVPEQWWIPEAFVDARSGDPLSDHLPVAATLSWTG